MVSVTSAPSAFRRTPADWPSRPGGMLQARKRQALKHLSQVNKASTTSRPQTLSQVKRKRVSLFAYGSSDTEEEDSASEPKQTAYTRRHTKRTRSAVEESEESKSSNIEDDDFLGSNVWDEGDLDDAPGSGSAGDLFFDLGHDDELTVEYARSSEPLQEVDLSDIFDFGRVFPEDDFSSDDNTSAETFTSSEDLLERPDVKAYMKALPSLLCRRVRKSVLSRRTYVIDDEPLRVKMLSRQFKNRLSAGDLTDTELMEVMTQRPMYGTYGDLNIPTPGPFVESQEDSDSRDVTELGADDLSLPERPTTPLPPNDSDSDSDSGSDSDEESSPVYSASQIANRLRRRELEALGIYPDDHEHDLSNGSEEGGLEELALSGPKNTSKISYQSQLEDILEEYESSD